MSNLTQTDLDVIKRYASHPSGPGYVADFSNQTFSIWFRDKFNIDIDNEKYEDMGTSKGNRLVSFCRQNDDTIVGSVLRNLRGRAQELGIEQSEIVKKRDLVAFDHLLERFNQDIVFLDETRFGEDQIVIKNVTRSQLMTNAKSNEASLTLMGAAAIESLSVFRERVRSDNYLPVEQSETYHELIKLLDALILHIENLLTILPSGSVAESESDGDQMVNWTRRYINGALPKLEEYFAPEKLGSSSVPVAVILACGGIGSLLTGFSPIGFGAGSVVGKLIVGEMKSGTAADQISERLQQDE